MRRPLARGVIVLAGLLPAFTGGVPERQDISIARLGWLAGCWESAPGHRRYEEQWMGPEGGTMLGMSRTVSAGRTNEFEFMHIREQEGRLVFTARPSGQREASFGSVEVSDTEVVFENAAHDFPQRITYRLEGDGSLAARIEGVRDGRPRAVDFPMRRTRCAGANP
jgi:hypothetical protein